MEQKLSDTLVKAIDRSNPMMQNLQLASRFNKLIDENVDLEDNKEATIDVSAYTDPVEVTPTTGKDGMKKATITLSNIPVESDLEDNHEVTITEDGEIEITPAEGKDGMRKVTATVNVPAPEIFCFTAFTTGDNKDINVFVTNTNKTVSSVTAYKGTKEAPSLVGGLVQKQYATSKDPWFRVDDMGLGTFVEVTFADSSKIYVDRIDLA